MDNGTKAAIGIGAAAAVIGGVYYLTKKASGTSSQSSPQPSPQPSSCSVSTLTLSASPTTVSPGGSVSFTAIAVDSNGNPVSDASITLVESTTNTTSTATTDSSGTADFSVTFPTSTQPGSYVFYAEAC